MVLKSDGFFDWTIEDPGPDSRWAYFGYATTPLAAIIHHSLEGHASLVSDPSTGYSTMRDLSRFPTAWHFTVIRNPQFWNGRQYNDGDVLQHYPIWARLQHGHQGNVLGPGGESEDAGIPGNLLRLTVAQENSFLRIHKDIEFFTGRKFTRVPGSKIGLVEHREVGPTSCPSDLYNGLWERIKNEEPIEDEDMADTRLREVLAKRNAIQEYAYGILKVSSNVDVAIMEALYNQLVFEGKIVAVARVDEPTN